MSSRFPRPAASFSAELRARCSCGLQPGRGPRTQARPFGSWAWGTFELGDEVDLEGKIETVGLPTPDENRPLNYAECVPEEERPAVTVALVAEIR